MQAYGARTRCKSWLTIKSDDTGRAGQGVRGDRQGARTSPSRASPSRSRCCSKSCSRCASTSSVLSSDGAAIEMRDGDDEDLERAAANLGINLSRNESASVEDLA